MEADRRKYGCTQAIRLKFGHNLKSASFSRGFSFVFFGSSDGQFIAPCELSFAGVALGESKWRSSEVTPVSGIPDIEKNDVCATREQVWCQFGNCGKMISAEAAKGAPKAQ
jgi:hypothetical protein